MSLDLAKSCVDVGLFTNRLDQMRSFYEHQVGLPYEELLPVGAGVRQYRYGLNGSVLKINHSRDPLPDSRRAGYRLLRIARDTASPSQRLADPDGNVVELVRRGYEDVTQVEIRLAVSNQAKFEWFFGAALGAVSLGNSRFKLGETICSFEHDPGHPGGPELRGKGFRYMTIQVRDCDKEHARLLAMGVEQGSAPITLGAVARISFIRDPDGDFIELSQRASLVGPLPK